MENPQNPASAPTVTPADLSHPELQPQTQTFKRRLDAAEEHWIWKLALRALLIVIAIIGIGCMAWATSNSANGGPYEYALDDAWTMCWSLITFGLTAIWCTVCILVLFLRRPNAPVHPGVAVGLDLVLWLAYIVTALFAVIGLVYVMNWGAGGTIEGYSSYGHFEQASNGTWIWQQTEYDSYRGHDRDCNATARYYSYDNYGFSTCAEEDAYVNKLWAAKSHRVATETTGVVCQFLGLFLHFVLFVWACVDTHRRKRRTVSKDAETLAGTIVMNMIKNGTMVPAQGQVAMQQPLLNTQQGYNPQYQNWAAAGPAPMGIAPVPMVPPQVAMRD
jgi:hypothetical protein